jgi:hypothetical protein
MDFGAQMRGVCMPSTVYIETTIPSAYVTTRTDPASLFRRQVTRDWWHEQACRYELLTADSVLIELGTGEWKGKDEALALIEAVPRLAIDAEVLAVARRYIVERLIPSDLAGDALHLAAACVHEVDYLLTWNIRHLANPNKTEHLVVVNRRLGLLTPQIVTPEALWIE